jgi:hypothetical protein
MIYKIKIDTRKAIEPLNKLGITTVDQENLFFFVNGENPDDACHIALNKLKTKIIEEDLTDEIVDYLEDELVHEIKVVKLRRVSPHP